MPGIRKTFSTTLIILLAIAFLAGGYFLYTAFYWRTTEPLKAIPSDAAVIIRINHAPSALKKLEENKIWNGLKHFDVPGSFLLDEFFTRLRSHPWLDQSTLYISLHKDTSLLITAGVADQSTAKSLRSALSSDSPGPAFKPWDQDLVVTKADTTGYYYFEKGVILISQNPGTIKMALEQLSGDLSWSDDPSFVELLEVSGNRVDANLYVNHPSADDMLSGNGLPRIDLINPDTGPLAQWSALDLIIKEEEMLFTGYTTAKGSDRLGRLKGQSPVELTADNVLPYLTRQFCWAGIPDLSSYIAENYTEEQQKSLAEYMLPWAGEEIVLADVNDPSLEGGASRLLLVKIRQGQNPYSHLGKLTRQETNYKGFRLQKIEGNIAEPVCPGEWKWWTSIDRFVAWSRSEITLRRMIDTYVTGKTLDVNENFAAFSDNIGEDGNLLFYINLRTSLGILAGVLPGNAEMTINDHPGIFGNFHGFSVQYSWLDGMALTNAVITYNENYREEDLASWKIRLDAPLAGKPYLVYDHRSKKNKIVVFDQQNNMYLIDDYGNMVWKLQLAELPIGNVYEVDYYRNGKIQYLFNTGNYLYLVDLMGRRVDNYPIRFNKSATSGLALFDYERDRDYRLLIPSEDKKVYNYDIKGNRISGWTDPKMENEIVSPPQHLVVNRKDYIIISDSEGRVRITDRRGNDRISLRENLVKSPNSVFYVNQTNSKGIILTTDNTGKLTYIGRNGEIEKTSFGDFGPDHFFLYTDFDRNGHNDFIFLDKDELYVYDRFKELIFFYEFESPVTSPPEIIQAGRGEKMLGVVSKSQKKVFLFNSRGEVLVSSGLVGETPFTVGSLGDNDELNLLVGSGSTLYNYPLN